MTRPQLTFFCELEAAALRALFADPAVTEDLQALGAGVSLGILDLSPERAEVVRHLNRAGIPIIAWQLLPEAQGYWFNAGNARQAAERYTAFQAWTAEQGLRWAGVGLDIEPDIREFQQLLAGEYRMLSTLLRRVLDGSRLHRARAEYRALVARMRADGYRVDSYQFPFVADERRAGSTFLQRLYGLVDIGVDREVLMLYSSFLRPNGVGMLWSYGLDARAIGVGSTGGGVQVGGIDQLPALDWPELSRDLRLARLCTDEIYVFSLEGCVRQGLLARLRGLDWGAPVAPPHEARKVEHVRQALRAGLWAGAHPLAVLAVAGGLVWALQGPRRRCGP